MYNLGVPEVTILLIVLLFVIFSIWMIIDAIRSSLGVLSKTIWVLALLIFEPFAAPIYFFVIFLAKRGLSKV